MNKWTNEEKGQYTQEEDFILHTGCVPATIATRTPLGRVDVYTCMSEQIEDDVIAIQMDDEMRVRLADWTPAWAYDALYERMIDSKSVDMDTVSDGDRLGTARVDTENKTITFVPN